MNVHTSTSPVNVWDQPSPSPEFLAKHSAEDVAAWRRLVARVIEIASANSWTKAEVTRRSQMKDGTFSQWFSGTYIGRLEPWNRVVGQWLDAVEDSAGMGSMIPHSPAFIKTKIAMEIMETLMWAQMTGDMVMVTIGAGMGKTATCRHFQATRPHVYHATVTPHTKTVHGMLVELASELDVKEYNPAKLTRAIGAKLSRIGGGTLLIVDEAQNLVDDAINQLRHFSDVYQCGVALVGNDEIYSRFGRANGGPSYAQLKSRVGKHLKRSKASAADLQAYIAAWEITDADCVKFLTGIGLKGGALRQIEKTVKLAYMAANGAGQALTLAHLDHAWRRRDVEDLS